MPAVRFSPIFNDQIVDSNGKPAVGYQIEAFAAGSANHLQTFTSSAGNVAHSNPIIINAMGYPSDGPIWLIAGSAYKLRLLDPDGAVVYTPDNISGVNDNSVSADEWGDTGAVPTYTSANTYTLQGDQTSQFHAGRRQKLQTTAGTVYGRILSSVFAASLTTVTLQMDGAETLDNGLSIVQNSILRANVLSLPERIATTTGAVNTYVASVGIQRLVIGDEYKLKFAVANDGALAPTLNLDATGELPILTQSGAVPAAGQLNGEHKVRATAAGFIVLNPVIIPTAQIITRQAINSAPVDANGFTALGGATGAATLTTTAISASAPIVVNAAGGSTAAGTLGDRIGSSSANLTWTGLNVNGTMQLSLDVSSQGTVTPVAGSLLTNYQPGGTFSIVNGQHTFNWGVMNQTVGNGTAAVQSYRVAVGEVTVAGGVVTAITWYALNHQYYKRSTGMQGNSTRVLHAHNLGLNVVDVIANVVNTTAEQGFTVGQRLRMNSGFSNGSSGIVVDAVQQLDRNTAATALNNNGMNLQGPASAPAGIVVLTAADWDTEIIVKRPWK